MESMRVPRFSLTGLKLIVDISSLICFISLAVSGFQLEESIEHGATVAGLRAESWFELHEFLFFAFSLLIVVHLFFNGKSLILRLKNLFFK